MHRLNVKEGRVRAAGARVRIGIVVALSALWFASDVCAEPIEAETGSGQHFYVGDQETYDSNLYRLPSNVTNVASLIAPNATRQDYINTLYVGMDGQKTLDQQSFFANLRLDDNRFDHNTELNNYSGYADLLWDWRVGSQFSGQVGGDYAHPLASFAETLYLGRDLVNATDYFGSLRYQIGPRWAVYGVVREADTSHSAEAAQTNDLQNTSGNLGIEYATSKENTLGWSYQFNHGRYPHDDFTLNGAPFDRDFNEDVERFIVKYLFTEKTQINASVGYQKRNYENESLGAFSGDVWNVTLDWQATEKTQISVVASRELGAYLDSQSNFYVATGGSISSLWKPSEKITLTLEVSSYDHNYISSSPAVLVLGSRDDRINTEQASVNYMPIQNLILDLSFSYQKRNSNQAVGVYDDKLAIASLKFKF